MNKADVIDHLRTAIATAGSQQAFAQQHGMSVQYVNDVLRGKRDPGPKILEALNYERVTLYRMRK